MKKIEMIVGVAAMLAMVVGCRTAEVPKLALRESSFSREKIEWNDVWIEEAEQPKLPRVLLIGDSISRQYRGEVSKLLRGKYALVNSAGSRCVGDPVLMAETRHLLSLYDYQVIHFNNGLHGPTLKDELFGAELRAWIEEIRRLQPKAKLVWATITHTANEFDARVKTRNAAADKVIAEYGDIAVDDLGALTAAHPEYLSGDKVHFAPEGVKALGKAVADSILAVK